MSSPMPGRPMPLEFIDGFGSGTEAEPVRPLRHRLVPYGLLVAAAALPYCRLSVPGVFDGPLNSPGTLQLLALCLVFGGVATGYDVAFGRTGLLSFGHALFFAVGAYGTELLLAPGGLPLWAAAVTTLAGGTLLAALLGAIALRTSGVAFAMVTLAFAQLAGTVIALNPGGLTGGEQGVALYTDGVPSWLVGVAHSADLYWCALVFLVVAVAAVHRVGDSPTGRVLLAIKDNERRAAVLGLPTRRYRLLAFVLSAAVTTAGGVVYLLLVSGAAPEAAGTNMTLSLLVMVVLGGSGTRWGPMFGGMVYTYAANRLTAVGGGPVRSLPPVLRAPLSQPLFVLGVLFLLAVYFFPGGLVSRCSRRAS